MPLSPLISFTLRHTKRQLRHATLIFIRHFLSCTPRFISRRDAAHAFDAVPPYAKAMKEDADADA